MNKLNKETFLEEVKEHAMTVVIDDEPTCARILRFRSPKSGLFWFDIVSWEGTLAITGDCGSFTFRYSRDVFELFRGKGARDLSYWAEKLVATDNTDGHERYNHELFSEHVLQEAKDFADNVGLADEGMGDNERERFMEAVNTDVLCDLGDESLDRKKAYEFEWHDHHVFQDFWEHDCSEYTSRFIWCCHAIVWGIQQYDAAKAVKP